LNEEEQALNTAKASDRAAKHQLVKKCDKLQTYQSLSDSEKEKFFATKLEVLEQKRFDEKKSGKLSQALITLIYLQLLAEWMTAALARVHRKWEDIYHQVDLKNHQAIIEKKKASKDSSPANIQSRSALRVFGSGGVLQKIMHRTYQDGLAKLNTNSFENKQAKDEWLAFVEGLSPDELKMVQMKSFQ
jgi:hypothetical protein